MFLFKRMNKMIQTGNNGRGPGGPRLPPDRRSESDDRCLNMVLRLKVFEPKVFEPKVFEPKGIRT